MSAGKPQGPPAIGMNSIITATNIPLSFEETNNELMQYTNLLAPLLLQFGTSTENSEEKNITTPEEEEEEENIILTEQKESTTILFDEKEETFVLANDKQIEEVKILSEVR
jgi:hypothetical protein